MKRLDVERMRAREYWTPGQAAEVLGRGASFWRDAFDRGDVDGYAEDAGGRRNRYILAASARGYLEQRSAAWRAAHMPVYGSLTAAALAAFDRG